MDIVSSVVRSSTPISGKRVDRELVVEITSRDVKTARLEAVHRLQQEHPEARFEAISHQIIERPRSGSGGAGIAFWSNPGKYHVTVRASGLLEVVD